MNTHPGFHRQAQGWCRPLSAAAVALTAFTLTTTTDAQAGFIHWEVVSGSVDLIGPRWWDVLPGNGLYVDLDGTTSAAGRMVSRTPFVFEAGRSYTLQFELGGNLRGAGMDFAEVQVAFGEVFTKTYARPPWATFDLVTEVFTVSRTQEARLSFAGLGGDRVGLLLDDIRLSVDGRTLLMDTFDTENGGREAANYGTAWQWDPLVWGDVGPWGGGSPPPPPPPPPPPGPRPLPDGGSAAAMLLGGVAGAGWLARRRGRS